MIRTCTVLPSPKFRLLLINKNNGIALWELFIHIGLLVWSVVFGLLLAADTAAYVSGHVFDLSDGPWSTPTKPLLCAH